MTATGAVQVPSSAVPTPTLDEITFARVAESRHLRKALPDEIDHIERRTQILTEGPDVVFLRVIGTRTIVAIRRPGRNLAYVVSFGQFGGIPSAAVTEAQLGTLLDSAIEGP